MRGMIWFREDLRLQDNTALFNAAKKCDEGIIGLYTLNPTMWSDHHVAACKVEFMLRGLAQLSLGLNKLNIPLLLIEITNTDDTPQEIYTIITKFKAQALFFNCQYEVNEKKRDQAVVDYLKKHDILCVSYHDQTILPPNIVTTQQGDFFKVFTAYKRAWYKAYEQNRPTLLPPPKKQLPLSIESSAIPQHLSLFQSTIDPKLWPAGELPASDRLRQFIDNHLFEYDTQRDLPASLGTSRLSPYLASGMISPRHCFNAALVANQQEFDSGNKGATTWLSELIWRDFYKNILITVPRVSMHRAYKPETEKIAWNFNQAQLNAWQQGMTGYPIIDAAMRQLNQTGWMHNRLRMITAMYLSKNLFFDWRLGEHYFISQLIDGDLAANNGGWQWSASTGTDSAPYFRIFNPVTQSERFDPDGKFIKQYCPELSAFNAKEIHHPHLRAPLLAAECHYPAPTVNLDISRKYAIEKFKALK